ncbi:MAG TPA: DNA recombination protein RmuC [Novosphingobium sp.]|nr:DNA recombination protein RmuC [Novosphingobium sp.]HQA17989.1 DNA recombination protein RmuC [Novosphingobium sp.]
MDGQILAIVLLLLGLAVGALGGWFAGSRPAAELRDRLSEAEGEAKELEGRFRAAVKELGDASIRLATLEANAAHFEEQKTALLTAQDSLKKEFENAGAKVLAQAQQALMAQAEQRFAHSEEKSAERLKALLAPVDQRLKSYEEQIQGLEKQRSDAFSHLYGQINLLREGQDKVREEAARLGNSLRNAPKARGRWGEQQLKNLLEQCGLAEHTDFVTEHSVDTEDGKLRPDAIVRIPGQKSLIIDAKVSLNAYQDAFAADSEDERVRYLAAHASAMRNHVQQLGAKAYHTQFEEAPDYVVMFVPGEHFVAAALEQDPGLWDFAFERRVLLATPTNLVAIARTVAMVWSQDKLAQEAIEIGRLGTEIYDRIATAGEHLKGVGAGLDRAVRKYNDFVGSFERNVMTSGRRLRDKGVAIGKREIEDVPLVEATPRHAEGGALAIEGSGEEA